jgi:PhzF family phenazine biosynthesis protein
LRSKPIRLHSSAGFRTAGSSPHTQGRTCAGSESIDHQFAGRFRQVDVFTTTAYAGNPVAVVLDGEGLSFEQMARFTRWTNLSEATFVVPPTRAEADYRVRIFTSASTTAARAGADWEVPFAGHPTLGTCHA